MYSDYKIMHKEKIIAETSGFQVSNILCPELCPVMLKPGSDVRPWVELRSIDTHRSNSRRLFKALRLNPYAETEDKIDIGHAVTIGDNWWMQKKDEALSYEKLKSYDSRMADIALNGSYFAELNIQGYTELGTMGSFEKAWRKENGTWYLYKSEKKDELISEYYAYSFLKAMSPAVADYSLARYMPETGIEREYIVSRDFTEGGRYDFESFECYFGDDSLCSHIVSRLEGMTDVTEKMIEAYSTTCLYDILLCNTDRHNGNIGFLRDSESGRIVALAPMFDYNIALASAGNLNFRVSHGQAELFVRDDMDVLKADRVMPVREKLTEAVAIATDETAKAFPDLKKTCKLCENYIMDSYDYLAERIYEKRQTLQDDCNFGNADGDED